MRGVLWKLPDDDPAGQKYVEDTPPQKKPNKQTNKKKKR
jgi:hypothetical protein